MNIDINCCDRGEVGWNRPTHISEGGQAGITKASVIVCVIAALHEWLPGVNSRNTFTLNLKRML